MSRRMFARRTGPTAVVLIAWASFFLFVLLTGRVHLYISPRFFVLPVLGIVLMVAMVIVLVSEDDSADATSHDHGSGSWDWVPFFLMPVVVGFLIAPMGMGSVVAANRQADLLGGARRFGTRTLALGTGQDYKDVTVYDLATAENLNANRIKVMGQILDPLPGMTAQRCPLAHYKMTCCVADLQPVAVILEYPTDFKPEPSQWVLVRGTARLDGEATVVKADVITPVAEPRPPYLY